MSGGGASLFFRSDMTFWMMKVTIVTDVPTIAAQMSMMSGPPSLIVSKMLWPAAAFSPPSSWAKPVA